MSKLWGYIEGQHKIFGATISPNDTIRELKDQIYEKHFQFIAQCSASKLTLTKVRYIMISM